MSHFFVAYMIVYYKIFLAVCIYFYLGGDKVCMDIYVDEMFVINLVVLFFLISFMDLVDKRKTSFSKKIMISVSFSVVYVLGVVFCFRYFISINYIFVVLLAVVYSVPCKLFDLVKNYIIITIFSCLIYGFLNYILNIFSALNIIVVLLGISALYIIIKILFFIYGAKKYYSLSIYNNNRFVKLTALMDTGNLLEDTITGKPVIIAEEKSLNNIMDNSPLRKLSYKSLGNENGYFYVFKADRAVINNNILYSPIIAIYNTRLSDNGEYNAIIGSKHLGGK